MSLRVLNCCCRFAISPAGLVDLLLQLAGSSSRILRFAGAQVLEVEPFGKGWQDAALLRSFPSRRSAGKYGDPLAVVSAAGFCADALYLIRPAFLDRSHSFVISGLNRKGALGGACTHLRGPR